MNKSELVDVVAQAADLPKSAVNKVVDAIVVAIMQALQSGQEVALPRLGKFTVSARSSRTGRDPRTGNPITISARNVPSFKAGKELKDAVNSATNDAEVAA